MAVVYAVKNPVSFDVPLKLTYTERISSPLLRNQLLRCLCSPQRSSDMMLYLRVRKLAGKIAISYPIAQSHIQCVLGRFWLTRQLEQLSAAAWLYSTASANAQATDMSSSIEAPILDLVGN
jgi:hypothetical protein